MLMANHSVKAPWDSWIQTLGQAKTRRKGSEAARPSQHPLTKSSTTLMIAFEWKFKRDGSFRCHILSGKRWQRSCLSGVAYLPVFSSLSFPAQTRSMWASFVPAGWCVGIQESGRSCRVFSLLTRGSWAGSEKLVWSSIQPLVMRRPARLPSSTPSSYILFYLISIFW